MLSIEFEGGGNKPNKWINSWFQKICFCGNLTGADVIVLLHYASSLWCPFLNRTPQFRFGLGWDPETIWIWSASHFGDRGPPKKGRRGLMITRIIWWLVGDESPRGVSFRRFPRRLSFTRKVEETEASPFPDLLCWVILRLGCWHADMAQTQKCFQPANCWTARPAGGWQDSRGSV